MIPSVSSLPASAWRLPRLTLAWGVLVVAAPLSTLGAPEAEGFFDQDRFVLARVGDDFRLQSTDGLALAVPREWLEPPETLALEEEAYVTSLAWEGTVTSFPIGGGRLGLHLSSYAIAEGGSAQAAAGRDLFLILDPTTGQLHRGLDLGEAKGRVRFWGCPAAWFHRVAVGDVECDRRLDLAVAEERISCEEIDFRVIGTETEEWVRVDRPFYRHARDDGTSRRVTPGCTGSSTTTSCPAPVSARCRSSGSSRDRSSSSWSITATERRCGTIPEGPCRPSKGSAKIERWTSSHAARG